MRSSQTRRLTLLVLAGELRRLVRDARALFFAVVLPMIAFPLLFLFSGNLEQVGRDALEARSVRVAHDLEALAPGDRDAILRGLGAPELSIELVPLEEPLERATEKARALLAQGFQVLLDAEPAAADAGPRALPELLVFYDHADERSREARERVRGALGPVLRAARDERLLALAGGDPGARYEALAVDVARPEDAAGQSLGTLLPLLAVLVLISAGSFAALDAFAGERESGTLETLLVQPVPASAIARGKFLAVLATGVLAFAGNALSLFCCLAFGVGSLPALPAGLDWTVAAGRLGLGCGLFLPTAALVSAALVLIAARARTFRHGQLLTTPLSFTALALAAPALQPTTELGPLLALVPVTGGALALRDAAAGVHAPLAQLLVFFASLGWTAVLLRGLATTLDAERLLGLPAASAEASSRRLAAQGAIRFGIFAVLVVYVLGGRMQAADPLRGLLATLYGLVLALAVVAALLARRYTGESLAGALGLRAPRAAHALGALLCAPAGALAVDRLFRLQQAVLPMPSSLRLAEPLVSAIGSLSLPALIFLLAVSPAICEELLFRGALLGAMRRDFRPLRVVAWQALLFGAMHAQIYRFAPTALMGGVLAALALRAGGVVPSMLLHFGYNAVLVSSALGGPPVLASPWLALLALPGAALLLLGPERRAGQNWK